MKYRFLFTILFIFFMIFQSCIIVDCTNQIQDGDETGIDCGGSCPECPPLVEILSVFDITSHSASVIIKFYQSSLDGTSEYDINSFGIAYSMLPNPIFTDYYSFVLSSKHIPSNRGFTDTLILRDLDADTTYYLQSFMTNNIATAYSNQVSFKTLSNSDMFPIVATNAITDISSNAAKCGGNIVSIGGSEVTSRGIYYGTDNNPAETGTIVLCGDGSGNFEHTITNLTPLSTYFVTAFASNSFGTSYGETLSFTTTQVIGIPTVITNSAYSITHSTASIGYYVTNAGSSAVNSRGVCWATHNNPSQADFYTNDGAGTGAFSTIISDLDPGTTYYACAYASNSQGIAYGDVVSFNTLVSCSGTISDYDGNYYNIIQIGNQCWMSSNLKVKHYPNGLNIPFISNQTSWSILSNDNLADAYCYYDNTSSYSTNYGLLYSYAAAIADNWDNDNFSNQGICPDGWHLPTDEEWQVLEVFLGMNATEAASTGSRGTNQGSRMSGSSNLWNDGSLENDSDFDLSGLNLVPSGYRSTASGFFGGIGYYNFYWTATEYTATGAYARSIYFNNTKVDRGAYSKSNGYSIRCVKNQ